jgi:hypothetical protein
MLSDTHDFSYHSGCCVNCGCQAGSPASERVCEPSLDPWPIPDGGRS